MQFFKRKLMYPARRRGETGKEIDRLFERYAASIAAIRDRLPDGARALSGISFHDATIKEVRHVSAKQVEILIEGGPIDILAKRALDYGGYALAFSDVRKAWVPHTVGGDTWLYEEMHLSDIAAFDYQVLLANDEIRIQAGDVVLSQTYEWSAGFS